MDLTATIPEDIQWTSKPLFQRIRNGPHNHYSRRYTMDLKATIPEDTQWTSQPLFQKIYNGPQSHYSRRYTMDIKTTIPEDIKGTSYALFCWCQESKSRLSLQQIAVRECLNCYLIHHNFVTHVRRLVLFNEMVLVCYD